MRRTTACRPLKTPSGLSPSLQPSRSLRELCGRPTLEGETARHLALSRRRLFRPEPIIEGEGAGVDRVGEGAVFWAARPVRLAQKQRLELRRDLCDELLR